MLFWHTEEDTIGYFDHPRLIIILCQRTALGKFSVSLLAPPGPAFGWHAGKFHAIDSLDMRRTSDERGCFTCVASWLAWRLGKTLDITEVIDALMPFVDGCAINVIEVKAGQTIAATHELGRTVASAELWQLGREAFRCKRTWVAKEKCSLFKEEGFESRGEAQVCEPRRARLPMPFSKCVMNGKCSPKMSSRCSVRVAGGNYANANEDVKAYCVGVASREGIEVSVHPVGPTAPSLSTRTHWMIVVSELPLPIAYFARGMDGLFLRPPAGFKLISLVRADCAQSDWLKRWLPTDQVLEFRLKRYRSDPYHRPRNS